MTRRAGSVYLGAGRVGAILLSCLMAAGCGLAPQLGKAGRSAAPSPIEPAAPGRVPVQLDSAGRHVRFHYQDELDPAGSRAQSLGATLNLSSVRLDNPSAQPGTEVIVSNVPMNAGKVRVAILNPDGSAFNWAMIRDLGSSDQFAMIAPLLPAGVAQGGTVQLKVYVRGASSSTLTLHLDPLPSVSSAQGAQGALQSLVSAIDNDPISGGATSSVGLLAHLFLDSPANPNSVAQILDGTAPMSQGQQTVDPSTLDSVFAVAGATSALASYRSALAQLTNVVEAAAPGAAPYRTQSFSVGGFENLLASELSSAIGQGAAGSADLQQLQDAESQLLNGEADAWNGLAGVAAALATDARSGSFSDVFEDATNTLAVASFVQMLFDLATLPSEVVLDPPEIYQGGAPLAQGAPLLDLYPANPQGSIGTWSVTGKITNAPVSISAPSILGGLTCKTLDCAGLVSNFFFEMGNSLFHANAGLAVCEQFGCTPQEQSNYEQWLSADNTLAEVVGTVIGGNPPFGFTSDLTYDPSTGLLSFAPGPETYYDGPLTRYCQAQYSRDGVLVPESSDTFLARATGSSIISILPQVPFFSSANQVSTSREIAVVAPAPSPTPTSSPTPTPFPSPSPTPVPSGSATAASLTIGTGASAVTYTAVTSGTFGNSIQVNQYAGGEVDISVQGETITAITGALTAGQLAAALNSIRPVAALVTVTTPGGGTGLAVWGGSANLSGGTGTAPGQYFNLPNVGGAENGGPIATLGLAPGYSVPDGNYNLQYQSYQGSDIWSLADTTTGKILASDTFTSPSPSSFTMTWGSGFGITVWPDDAGSSGGTGGSFLVEGP